MLDKTQKLHFCSSNISSQMLCTPFQFIKQLVWESEFALQQMRWALLIAGSRPINMFTDRGPGMEIPGGEWLLCGRGTSLKVDKSLEGDKSLGANKSLEVAKSWRKELVIEGKEKYKKTINMFPDQGHWMEMLGEWLVCGRGTREGQRGHHCGRSLKQSWYLSNKHTLDICLASSHGISSRCQSSKADLSFKPWDSWHEYNIYVAVFFVAFDIYVKCNKKKSFKCARDGQPILLCKRHNLKYVTVREMPHMRYQNIKSVTVSQMENIGFKSKICNWNTYTKYQVSKSKICRPHYGRWTTCVSNLWPQIMFSLHRKHVLPYKKILMLLLFTWLTCLQLLIKIIITVTVITMVRAEQSRVMMVRAGLISHRGQLGLICVPPAV